MALGVRAARARTRDAVQLGAAGLALLDRQAPTARAGQGSARSSVRGRATRASSSSTVRRRSRDLLASRALQLVPSLHLTYPIEQGRERRLPRYHPACRGVAATTQLLARSAASRPARKVNFGGPSTRGLSVTAPLPVEDGAPPTRLRQRRDAKGSSRALPQCARGEGSHHRRPGGRSVRAPRRALRRLVRERRRGHRLLPRRVRGRRGDDRRARRRLGPHRRAALPRRAPRARPRRLARHARARTRARPRRRRRAPARADARRPAHPSPARSRRARARPVPALPAPARRRRARRDAARGARRCWPTGAAWSSTSSSRPPRTSARPTTASSSASRASTSARAGTSRRGPSSWP